MTNRNVLYRIFTEGRELLYVGATTNPGLRIESHRTNQPWWDEASIIELERFDTSDELMQAEADAIKSENPRHNSVHNKPQSWSRKPRGRRGDGTVYQRTSDGLWIGRIELPSIDGKRRYKWVSSKDRTAAELKMAHLRAGIAAT